MRDLLIALLIAGSLPLIFMRPWVGVLVWVWISFMNPHLLAWGFARGLPWVLVVAGITLLMYFTSSDRKTIPLTPITVVWLAYFAWTFVTLLFAVNPEGAWIEWDRWWRIQIMVVLVLMAIHTRERLDALVWVVALSIGFYGIKGGIFSVLTGGQYMVAGPGGFIGGNNEIALALLMVLPLFWYLRGRTDNIWIQRSMLASMGLTALAILATYSRGAMLGLATMGFVLWTRTRNRLFSGSLFAVLAVAMLAFLPDKWFDRMGTIDNFEEDKSAMGRINAWWFAFHLANERPLTGGGFRAFTAELFMKYAPDPLHFVDAHSIYFEVLGEQGYVGLGLFLTMGVLVVLHTQGTMRRYRNHPTESWAAELSAMLQVGFIGYAACGAFLGLSYFDLPYVLMAMVVLTRIIADRAAAAAARATTVADAAVAAANVGTTPAPVVPTRRPTIGTPLLPDRPASRDLRKRS